MSSSAAAITGGRGHGMGTGGGLSNGIVTVGAWGNHEGTQP
jgi:hypothetical protein